MRNDYKIDGDIVTIYLRRRKSPPIEAIVSIEDLSKILEFDVRWSADYNKQRDCYMVKHF